MTSSDVIVVGLGAMGSAALRALAKAGVRTLGLDMFSPPHTEGSTHGESRITRWANGEGDFYQPLIKRSFELWEDIEQETGETLFHPSGGLIIAPKEGGAGFHGHAGFVERSASIAKTYGVKHQVLDARGIKQHAPMLKVTDSEHAYYSPSSGILRPEKCTEMQLRLARKKGATLRLNERVLEYSYSDDSVTLTTDKEHYQAEKIIFTTGAWMRSFMPKESRNLLKIYTQDIFWFEVDEPKRFYHENFPFVMWTKKDRNDYFCAFPTPEDGTPALKIMSEQYLEWTPEPLKTQVSPGEQEAFYETYIVPNIKGVKPSCVKAARCHYTLTPDEHFILDVHPDSERVVLASPCSGHGFKFSSAIGECLAQLALEGRSNIDLGPFRLDRFKEG